MAITVVGYGQGILAGLKAGQDFDGVTYKLALVTATYTPNVDADDFFNDANANELGTANGYTAGGVTLASLTLTYDTATDQIRWDFADPSWTFSGAVTWRYGVAYNSTPGTAGTNNLMFLLDWGTSQTVSGVYTVTLDPAGLYAIDLT